MAELYWIADPPEGRTRLVQVEDAISAARFEEATGALVVALGDAELARLVEALKGDGYRLVGLQLRSESGLAHEDKSGSVHTALASGRIEEVIAQLWEQAVSIATAEVRDPESGTVVRINRSGGLRSTTRPGESLDVSGIERKLEAILA